jgi:hypothetical protein
MNAERRKALNSIKSLGSQVEQLIEQMKSALVEVQEAEQDAFDNLPESFQNGERGEKAQAAIDAISNADSDLDDIVTSLENFANYVDEASE